MPIPTESFLVSDIILTTAIILGWVVNAWFFVA